jgi:hypothetical protein
LLISRNYRLYTAGQGVSLAGTWMQTVGLGWLVLQLTGSGTSVGLVTAAQFIPVLLLAPLGGVFIDRLDTRKVLLCTQALSGLLALGLGLLTISGDVRLWMVYAIAAAAGLLQVVDNPAPPTLLVTTRRSGKPHQRHHPQYREHESGPHHRAGDRGGHHQHDRRRSVLRGERRAHFCSSSPPFSRCVRRSSIQSFVPLARRGRCVKAFATSTARPGCAHRSS